MIRSHPTSIDAHFLTMVYSQIYKNEFQSATVIELNYGIWADFIKIQSHGVNIGITGGRLGYLLGSIESNAMAQPAKYWKNLLKDIMIQENLQIITLTWPDNVIACEIFDSFRPVVYDISSIQESFSEKDQTIGKGGNRNEIKRMIRKAKASDYHLEISTNRIELKQWYDDCYTVRMSEIIGERWPYVAFDASLQSGAKLLLCKCDNRIIGGILFLENQSTIEVLAIASSKESQNQGTNYLLTLHLFEYAYHRGLIYFNWQGSSSRVGGVAHFKRQWSTEEHIFLQGSMLRDFSVRQILPVLRQKLPLLSVYPD